MSLTVQSKPSLPRTPISSLKNTPKSESFDAHHHPILVLEQGNNAAVEPNKVFSFTEPRQGAPKLVLLKKR